MDLPKKLGMICNNAGGMSGLLRQGFKELGLVVSKHLIDKQKVDMGQRK